MADKTRSEDPSSHETPNLANLKKLGGGDKGTPGPDGSIDHPLHVAGRVSLMRAEVVPTSDAALWTAIRNRTDAIRGDRYERFIERVLCGYVDPGPVACPQGETRYEQTPTIGTAIQAKRDELIGATSGYGVDAYNLLKYATQAFLLLETGVVIRRPRRPLDDPGEDLGNDLRDEEARIGDDANFGEIEARLQNYLGGALNGSLPYLKRVVAALDVITDSESPFCKGTLTHRFSCPSMLELIWSYWMEEGMLVQTMNAICMRFQNKRGPLERDPLANLEIDPLRPLNNLLWGYIQDEYNRLTVLRRAYEFDHQYGLKLVGKAVPELRSADSRSKFIEAFHNLLYRAAAFYREDADTTVIADAFTLLSSLRDVHLLLAEGAHNQFNDLPWTARAEMLMMQWLLGRQEMREFLRGRVMVPYSERWMGQVDTMKKLQGWTDTSITHFRNLAVFGEQILLSIRYGDWSEINNQDFAKTWARDWRPEVQGYIYSYHAATGIDLSEETVDTKAAAARYAQPSFLLEQRAGSQLTGMQPLAIGKSGKAGAVTFGAVSSRRRALNAPRTNDPNVGLTSGGER